MPFVRLATSSVTAYPEDVGDLPPHMLVVVRDRRGEAASTAYPGDPVNRIDHDGPHIHVVRHPIDLSLAAACNQLNFMFELAS